MAKKKQAETIEELLEQIESSPEDFIQPEVSHAELLAAAPKQSQPQVQPASPNLNDVRNVDAQEVLKILLCTDGGLAAGFRKAVLFLGGKDECLNLTELKNKYNYNAKIHTELVNMYRTSGTHVLSAQTLTVVPKRGRK